MSELLRSLMVLALMVGALVGIGDATVILLGVAAMLVGIVAGLVANHVKPQLISLGLEPSSPPASEGKNLPKAA